jgi:hypothetical protein
MEYISGAGAVSVTLRVPYCYHPESLIFEHFSRKFDVS